MAIFVKKKSIFDLFRVKKCTLNPIIEKKSYNKGHVQIFQTFLQKETFTNILILILQFFAILEDNSPLYLLRSNYSQTPRIPTIFKVFRIPTLF